MRKKYVYFGTEACSRTNIRKTHDKLRVRHEKISLSQWRYKRTPTANLVICAILSFTCLDEFVKRGDKLVINCLWSVKHSKPVSHPILTSSLTCSFDLPRCSSSPLKNFNWSKSGLKGNFYFRIGMVGAVRILWHPASLTYSYLPFKTFSSKQDIMLLKLLENTFLMLI